MKFKTDIERLHNVTHGNYCSRGAGKTTARIHELASVIQLDKHRDVIVIINTYRDMDYLLPMIWVIFEERGLPKFNRCAGNILKCGDIYIKFLAYNNPEFNQKIAGLGEYALVSMGHRD